MEALIRSGILLLSVVSSRSSGQAAERDAGELCIVMEMAGPRALRAIRETWLDNRTSIFFVSPEHLPSWPGDGGSPTFRLWGTWVQRLPTRCTWLLKAPASSYLNLNAIRSRLDCLARDPSLLYLGIGQAVYDEKDDESPVPLVAQPTAGVLLHRSLFQRLSGMLEACVTQSWFRRNSHLGEARLGICLLKYKVEMSSWLQTHDEAIFNAQAVSDLDPIWSASFRKVSMSFDAGFLSRVRCLFIVSGLRPQEIYELHAMMGKSSRWFKGISCTPSGLTYPELTSMDVGKGPKLPIFAPRVRTALQECFLARAFNAMQTSARDGQRRQRATLSSPAELAQEWKHPQRGSGAAVDRLSRGGHEVCVFVLTAAASAKHRAHARASYETWGSQKPPGVEVFFVKDSSWTAEELTGRPHDEDPENILSLRGDVDLGFLYNPVRAFYLWLYLAEHHASDCGWFVKVDGDTFVNLWSLKLRLQRYFNSSDSHYLGSPKTSHLASGTQLRFAVNSIVLSSGLIQLARKWFRTCLNDVVYRRLGEGAEDMDMAMCLKQHGPIFVEALGKPKEINSASMLAVKSGGRGAEMLQVAKVCTLMIHPIPAEEMYEVFPELLRLVRADEAASEKSLCDWPQDDVQQSAMKDWNQYMATSFHANDHHVCWDRRFTWQLCCHPNFGPGGNENCWDDENTWARCCKQKETKAVATQATLAVAPPPAQEKALSPESEPSTYGLARVTSTVGSGASAPRITAVSGSFAQAPSQKGNPKCWSEGFSFELCCADEKSAGQCWTWPFSQGFCCLEPLPPRSPLQAGGLKEGVASATAGNRPRTSRCPHAASAEDAGLLACKLSLDEIGALFELPAIGSGDKASGWHDYLGNYERLLFHLPLSASVLEFGVRMGSSLAMWSEYFPYGTIVGMDKNLATFNTRGKPVLTAHGAFTRGNVYVMQANASDESGLAALSEVGFTDGFDVIVDDANHWAKDQIARFELYFPSVLRPGGVYLIEDVHIQAPFTADGNQVRSYLADLSAGAYLSPEILLGSHHIRASRKSSQDWRHKVEWVTFLRDMVAIGKSEDAS